MRGASLVAGIGALLLAGGALAQVGGRIELGRGISVRQDRVAVCVGAGPCALWIPEGFGYGELGAVLPFARTFAWVPRTGRIVASVPLPSVLAYQVTATARLVVSDDRGAHWRDARWPWRECAESIAFDPEGLGGVAGGEAGTLWTTEDGGDTWTDHGSTSGTRWVSVARRGRAIVMVGDNGSAYVSRDGGFARRELAASGASDARVDGDVIVVRVGSSERRVDAEGRVR